MKKTKTFHECGIHVLRKTFRIMRIILFLIFAVILQSFANESYSQKTRLSLDFLKTKLVNVLDEIEENSEFFFLFNEKLVDTNREVSVSFENKEVDEILDKLFDGTDIVYTISDRKIILAPELLTKKTQKQTFISGTVTDEAGKPLPGVTVLIKGTTNGTVTNVDGNYSISNVPGNATLQFSFVGMLTQEVEVGNQATIDITMKMDAIGIEEVVAVGYGTQKRVNLTGSVSSVKSEELVVTKNENPVNLLTGKMAGVRVAQGSSEPGRNMSKFDIRGYGSSPLVVIDGVARDGFQQLNPEDIESISVLKDASASVYGVRAANGVLLITTKTGKPGAPKVSYSFNGGIQQMLNVPSQTTALQYYMMKNEQRRRQFRYFTGFNDSDVYSEQAMAPFINGERQTTDWRNETLREFAPQTSHNISISGGTNKVNYYIGAGYMDQNSFFKSGDLNYKKFNLRAKLGVEVTDNLKLDVGVYGQKNRRQSTQVDSKGLLKSLYTNMPDDPVYAYDDPKYPWKTADEINPVVMMDRNLGGYRDSYNYEYKANVAAHFKIPNVEGLAVHGLYSYDFNLYDSHNYAKAHNLYRLDGDNLEEFLVRAPSRIERYSWNKNASTVQLSVDYNRIFAEKHNVQLLVLFEESHFLADNYGAGRRIYVDLPYLFAGSTDKQYTWMGADNLEGVNKGFVGKAHYDYSSKYLIDLAARYDGSYKFKSGSSQWGFFPSVSLGWRISQEAFLRDFVGRLSISDLKLRGSYGKLGDDRASSFQYITGYQFPRSGYVVDGVYQTGTETKGIANENITWYTSTITNLGFDAKLFEGKLAIAFDYFIRDREGLLGTRVLTLPGTFGASLPQENINSDQTEGFEVELTYKNRINDLKYSITGLFSQTRTRIIHSERAESGNSYENWRNNPQGRYNDIWWGKGYEGRYLSYDQVYNDEVNRGGGNMNYLPGDYIYEDWNGDGTINYWDNKPIAIKNTPVLNYSTIFTAEYKNFDLYLQFQGTLKAYKEYEGQVRDPLTWGRNSLDYFWDRWHPVDPKADFFDPHTEWVQGEWMVSGSRSITDAANIQNASYLRLKTLELGYTVPERIIKGIGQNLRIYVNAYNLLTFTKFKFLDPEAYPDSNNSHRAQASYPNNRVYNIGAKITF